MKKCLFCNIDSEPLIKLYEWDKPDTYNWYCEKHYGGALGFQTQQRERFIKYYEVPQRYEQLNSIQKDLYNRLIRGR
ncbi:hypothetical protein AKG34_21395 [Peribacillus butanolivorans]|nr:hypothetical protein AKG34_21395 [Peribacillus butanolivorans]